MARLLVIDDDRYVRELVPRLAYQMAGKALQVVHASDLGEALAICAAQEITLVLSDYFMPDFDGPELLHRLRTRHPTLRAMLMTGDANMVGRTVPEASVPVRDKADLDAIVREAIELALEPLA